MMQAGLEEGAAAVEKERARVTKIISDKVMIDMVKMMVVITTKIRHDMQNLNKGEGAHSGSKHPNVNMGEIDLPATVPGQEWCKTGPKSKYRHSNFCNV